MSLCKLEIHTELTLYCFWCGNELSVACTPEVSKVGLRPCQTCLDAARKAAGDAAYIKGYDKAINDLDRDARAIQELSFKEPSMTREDVMKAFDKLHPELVLQQDAKELLAFDEPITSDSHELDDFNSARARGLR